MSLGYENCHMVRFVKPEESGRSFCVTPEEASEVEKNVKKYFYLTTTHKEKTPECDHLTDFQAKQT